MTFEQLDVYVSRYLTMLKQQRAIKNIGAVSYKIVHSKKSRSFYVKLFLFVAGKQFRKTIRFSDHECPFPVSNHLKTNGVILESSKTLSKQEIKYIEATLRRGIKHLQYSAHMTTVYNFKATLN